MIFLRKIAVHGVHRITERYRKGSHVFTQGRKDFCILWNFWLGFVFRANIGGSWRCIALQNFAGIAMFHARNSKSCSTAFHCVTKLSQGSQFFLQGTARLVHGIFHCVKNYRQGSQCFTRRTQSLFTAFHIAFKNYHRDRHVSARNAKNVHVVSLRYKNYRRNRNVSRKDTNSFLILPTFD